MNVELVAVGEELLGGTVGDANGPVLARLLAARGHRLDRVAVVGDDEDAIRDAVASAVARGPLAVVVSGGLGPTSDDRTGPALTSLVRARGARVREVPNPSGTAPGLAARLGGVDVLALPGVPFEFAAMAEAFAGGLPVAAQVPTSRVVHVAGIGETEVARRIAEVERGGLTVAYLPTAGEVVVRITGADRAAVDAAAGRAQDLLGADAVGPHPLDAAVHELLAARGATVATAESLTGGGVAAALTERPGASATVLGGVVAYATEVKTRLLGVPPGLVAAHGVVSEEVAAGMARAARELLGADLGVATTGVAGPDPLDGIPAGTFVVAVSGPAGERTRRRATAAPPGVGGRAVVRRRAVVAALDLLRRELLGRR